MVVCIISAEAERWETTTVQAGGFGNSPSYFTRCAFGIIAGITKEHGRSKVSIHRDVGTAAVLGRQENAWWLGARSESCFDCYI